MGTDPIGEEALETANASYLSDARDDNDSGSGSRFPVLPSRRLVASEEY